MTSNRVNEPSRAKETRKPLLFFTVPNSFSPFAARYRVSSYSVYAFAYIVIQPLLLIPVSLELTPAPTYALTLLFITFHAVGRQGRENRPIISNLAYNRLFTTGRPLEPMNRGVPHSTQRLKLKDSYDIGF